MRISLWKLIFRFLDKVREHFCRAYLRKFQHQQRYSFNISLSYDSKNHSKESKVNNGLKKLRILLTVLLIWNYSMFLSSKTVQDDFASTIISSLFVSVFAPNFTLTYLPSTRFIIFINFSEKNRFVLFVVGATLNREETTVSGNDFILSSIPKQCFSFV